MNRNKQQGAALFVSLIFLLILTVLGVASMNDTIMQGKMAAAIQDGNVALQGAETAIRDAETFLNNITSTGGFDNSSCLYREGDAPDPFDAAIWASSAGDDTCEASALAGQTNAARYFIEQSGGVTDTSTATSVSLPTYSHEAGSGTIRAFRIVARATGGTTRSQRFIESFYALRF